MIIVNGTIEVKTKTGGGIDPETGFPRSVSATWSVPIPCQFYANKYSNLGRTGADGHYTVASYTILIEDQPFCAEQIRLKDLCGNEIGEYSIIQAEPLEAVCEIRITV